MMEIWTSDVFLEGVSRLSSEERNNLMNIVEELAMYPYSVPIAAKLLRTGDYCGRLSPQNSFVWQVKWTPEDLTGFELLREILVGDGSVRIDLKCIIQTPADLFRENGN